MYSYDDYFQTFAVKRLEDLQQRQSKLLPDNPRIKKEIQEIKDYLYKNWLIEINSPIEKPKQLELF